MDTIRELMLELDGADADTVNRIAWNRGSLPVRLAMLGLAESRKSTSPLWFGYPPTVFISYKWAGQSIRDLVTALADHVRELGYRAALDIESLDEAADSYFQIPEFIASLHECTFYVLLLTELSADLMSARHGKTTWIHDEYQAAVRLVNAGRLVLVPVLLEPAGATETFTKANSIDLTSADGDFSALAKILTPGPLSLTVQEVADLEAAMTAFDAQFLNADWDGAHEVLADASRCCLTFDHQFRRMLLSIYTADEDGLKAARDALIPVYGEQLVQHAYAGYCSEHGIPNRAHPAI